MTKNNKYEMEWTSKSVFGLMFVIIEDIDHLTNP